MMNLSKRAMVSSSIPLKRCCCIRVQRRIAGGQSIHKFSQMSIGQPGEESLKDLKKKYIKGLHDGKEPVDVDARPKFAFFLNGAVKAQLERKEMSVGKHAGVRRLLPIEMPEKLKHACSVVCEGDKKNLRKDAEKLFHRIGCRKTPLEQSDMEHRMEEIKEEVIGKETVDPNHPEVLDVDREKLLKQREFLIKQRIFSSVYNYRPIDYSTARMCLLYMMSRLAPDYAALVKAFSQLRAQMPNFVPTTMMDFGSGVGSATWAVDRVWQGECEEIVNIDISDEMNILNERLQKGGTLEGEYSQRRKNTFFRQHLPASANLKHNLVVMSRTFFELDCRDTRIRVLDILWKTVTPGGCLVLVDAENWRVFELMLEAREFLREGTDVTISGPPGQIVAPCPHQFTCPLLKKQRKYRRCTDEIMHFTFDKDEPTMPLETFSYLVVYKPKSSDSAENLKFSSVNSWPRIVQPVKTSAHSVVRLCTKYGHLQQVDVTRAKHGVICNQVGRKSRLGDFLPVELLAPGQQKIPALKLHDQVRVRAKEIAISKAELRTAAQSQETDENK